MPAHSPAPAPPPPGHRSVWRWVRRYFGFSRAQNQGVLLLLLVALVLSVGPVLLRPAAPAYLPAADQRQLDAWAGSLRYRIDSGRAGVPPAGRYPRYKARPAYPAVPLVRLAPFDPNSLSARDWEARGVPHFVAGRIVTYGQLAGGFRAKSQVQRIYGLPDSVYRRLAPFMLLPDSLPRRRYARGTLAGAGAPAPRLARKPAHLQPFDLNLADTAQLRQIKGIGRGRALAIVRRRTELGGFVSGNQLSEVYVLRDAPDLVDSVRKYTFVAAGFVPQPVHLNSASFDELWLHPYVGKPLARAIVAYRKQHGAYASVDDLLKIRLVKPEEVERLRPYARCD